MLVYIIHDVVIVLSEMLWVYVRKLGGEGRIEKGEEFHLFGGRGEVGGEGGGGQGRNLNVWGGEERRISTQKVSLVMVFEAEVGTANRYVFPSCYSCSFSKIGVLSATIQTHPLSNGKTE